MRTTIKDVAALAKVSITTVSFVMNGKARSIPYDTQQRVRDAAKELNYVPNRLARGLVMKTTKTLALIVPDIKNPFFADMVQDIDLAAKERGYMTIIGESSIGKETYLELINNFTSRQIDGIIIARSRWLTQEQEVEVLNRLFDQSIPFIAFDSNVPDEKINSITVDHEKGAYMAVKHLVELGHQKIGVMTGPKYAASNLHRIDGYRKAIAEAGIYYDDRLLFGGDYTLDKCEDAFRFFLEKGVTAIFAMNDIMALGLYKEASKHDMRIPRDMSIVGFDNIWASDIVYPTLTTVSQKSEEIAHMAIDILCTEIEEGRHPEKGTKVLIEPALIVRESSAAPKK